MYKFYFILWLQWLIKLTTISVVYATIISLSITLLFYINLGMATIDTEISLAIIDIFKFWFPIVWSFTLLISLFKELKNIFNSCHNGYKFQLLNCKREIVEVIGYGDIVKIWRKYLILLIWIVAAEMIISVSFSYLIYKNNQLFDWFNIYVLYIFVLFSSYFSFIILSSKCKLIKVQKC